MSSIETTTSRKPVNAKAMSANVPALIKAFPDGFMTGANARAQEGEGLAAIAAWGKEYDANGAAHDCAWLYDATKATQHDIETQAARVAAFKRGYIAKYLYPSAELTQAHLNKVLELEALKGWSKFIDEDTFTGDKGLYRTKEQQNAYFAASSCLTYRMAKAGVPNLSPKSHVASKEVIEKRAAKKARQAVANAQTTETVKQALAPKVTTQADLMAAWVTMAQAMNDERSKHAILIAGDVMNDAANEVGDFLRSLKKLQAKLK